MKLPTDTWLLGSAVRYLTSAYVPNGGNYQFHDVSKGTVKNYIKIGPTTVLIEPLGKTFELVNSIDMFKDSRLSPFLFTSTLDGEANISLRNLQADFCTASKDIFPFDQFSKAVKSYMYVKNI